MEDLEEHVCNILVRVNKKTEANLDSTKLVSDGVLDSLDIMNLITELEGEFDIEIEPEDVLSVAFESVEAIVALIKKCRS